MGFHEKPCKKVENRYIYIKKKKKKTYPKRLSELGSELLQELVPGLPYFLLFPISGITAPLPLKPLMSLPAAPPMHLLLHTAILPESCSAKSLLPPKSHSSCSWNNSIAGQRVEMKAGHLAICLVQGYLQSCSLIGFNYLGSHTILYHRCEWKSIKTQKET